MNKLSKIAISLLLASSVVACSTAPKQGVNTTPAVEKEEAKFNKKRNDARMDLNGVLSKRTILFDYDKFDVKPEYADMIKAHVEYKKTNKDVMFIIEGHADERGTTEYNLSLGQKRAAAVKDVILGLGISEEAIETVSYGKEKPTCLNATEKCYTENRRSIILYTDER